MPQLMIKYGYIDPKYTTHCQAIEVAAIVYVACGRPEEAMLAGGGWFAYNYFLHGS